MKLPDTEPIFFANVSAAILALLGMLVALGVIQILPEQMKAIEQAIGAVLTVAAPLIAMLWARSKVTPLALPRDTDGRMLVRPDGMPPLEVQRMVKEMKGG